MPKTNLLTIRQVEGVDHELTLVAQGAVPIGREAAEFRETEAGSRELVSAAAGAARRPDLAFGFAKRPAACGCAQRGDQSVLTTRSSQQHIQQRQGRPTYR